MEESLSTQTDYGIAHELYWKFEYLMMFVRNVQNPNFDLITGIDSQHCRP